MLKLIPIVPPSEIEPLPLIVKAALLLMLRSPLVVMGPPIVAALPEATASVIVMFAAPPGNARR